MMVEAEWEGAVALEHGAIPVNMQRISKARRLQSQIKGTQLGYIHSLEHYADQLVRVDTEDYSWPPDPDLVGLDPNDLLARAARLESCGKTVEVEGWHCGHGLSYWIPGQHGDCCGDVMCPRYQRKWSARWVRRALAGMPVWSAAHPDLRWKFITIGLKEIPGETVAEDVDRIIKTRAALARFLRKEFGLAAGFGKVEASDRGHVHLHMLALCEWVPRDLLQHWLRARDCSHANGCSHEADTRCKKCQEQKIACAHLDPGQIHCDGSWYVDIRAPKGAGSKEKAVKEALKYTLKPATSHPEWALSEPRSEDFSEFSRQCDFQVLFFLALGNRHVIETYGDARKKVAAEISPGVAAETEEVFDGALPKDTESPPNEHPCCFRCGCSDRFRDVGSWDRDHGYKWQLDLHPPDAVVVPDSPVARAGPTQELFAFSGCAPPPWVKIRKVG